MKRDRKTTPTVEAIHQINFSGNVIPREWNHHIRRESGAPDPVAVYVLSEIVYWYRPTEVNDERTGRTVRYERKFAADKLQVNRKAWAQRLGYSLKQIDTALKTLRRLGLITTELRNITSAGQQLYNVMFVEPVPGEIAKINALPDPNALYEQVEDDPGDTGSESDDETEADEADGDDVTEAETVQATPSRLQATPSRPEARPPRPEATPSRAEARPSIPGGETYTKTSSEISSQISSAAAGEGDEESLRLELERRFSVTAQILKDKLCNRADAADEGVYFECLREDPLRLNWLTLRPSEVRALIKRADAAYTAGKKGFKKAFIDLLDVAVGIDRKPERASAVAEDEGDIPQTLEERQAIAAKTNSTLPPNLQRSLAAREAKQRGH